MIRVNGLRYAIPEVTPLMLTRVTTDGAVVTFRREVWISWGSRVGIRARRMVYQFLDKYDYYLHLSYDKCTTIRSDCRGVIKGDELKALVDLVNAHLRTCLKDGMHVSYDLKLVGLHE